MSNLSNPLPSLGGLLRRFRVRPVSWLAAFAVVAAVVAAAPAAAAAEPGGGLTDDTGGPKTTSDPPLVEEPSPDDVPGDLVDDAPTGPVANTGAATYEILWTLDETTPRGVEAVEDNDSVDVMTAVSTDNNVFVALLTIEDAGAPSEFRFEGAVPDGYTAKQQPDGSIMLADADGNEAGGWAEPWAFDANGTAVATSLALEGSTLVQTVDHHGAAYPVVADPCRWSWRGLLDCATIAVVAASAAVACGSGVGTPACVVAISAVVVTTIHVETSPAGATPGCRRNPRAPNRCR